MNDEQIKQRIAYLVEHGGICDDPLNEIRRTARIALGLAAALLVLSVVELLIAVN